jgi:hypothetical protein
MLFTNLLCIMQRSLCRKASALYFTETISWAPLDTMPVFRSYNLGAPIVVDVFVEWILYNPVNLQATVHDSFPITDWPLNLNTGKSSFLYYVLFRLLSERKPVAFQLPNQFVVFQEDSIHIHPLSADGHLLPKGTWALCDSYEGSIQPCDAFLNASWQKTARIIQTTSALETWQKWEVRHSASVFVMKPFSAEDMAALASVKPVLKCSCSLNFLQ